ncbi:MAG: hypothetical protein ACR2G5_15365 [Pyrinomonadaceae bacterium]
MNARLVREMMKLIILVTCLLLVLITGPAAAQQKAEPAFKMVEFHMALLKRGPALDDRRNAGEEGTPPTACRLFFELD